MHAGLCRIVPNQVSEESTKPSLVGYGRDEAGLVDRTMVALHACMDV